jgi:hypothetical protein
MGLSVKINSEDLKHLKGFEVTCMVCGSTNSRIEIDWAAYPGGWNNTRLICLVCDKSEIVCENN